MASVTYYLNKNKTDKQGRIPIMLQYDHKGDRFKYYTGEKIEAKYWSKSSNRYIVASYDKDGTLDEYLKSLKNKVENIAIELKKDDIPVTASLVKTRLLLLNNQDLDKTFFPLYKIFVETAKTTKAPSTIKNYNNSLHYYEKFSDEKNFYFHFAEINKAFYSTFTDFLIEDQGLSNNTVGRVVKDLKTFLNWTIANGYSKNLEYKNFKILREDIEIVYLTSEELDRLYDFKFESEALKKTRDLFCFGCFTGLRFSDIANLDKSNVKGGEILIRIQKTKEIIAIPLLSRAEKILKRYKYKLPVITNQKLNFNLKKICEKAEINQKIKIHKYRGSKRDDSISPKYELITTHSARRTFITLSLEKGIRPEVVMAITGHKSYNSFKKYIKITDNIKKNELLKAWE
ncbi:MAG: site-specific integrase [Candidatus Hodarchaeales archaeon]